MSDEPDYADEQAWCEWYDSLPDEQRRQFNKAFVARTSMDRGAK
jgi:hypothetical protein